MASGSKAIIQEMAVSPETLEAMLSEKPAVVSRMVLRVFHRLAKQNPFLAPQLDRTRRRILALNRLEWRALRGGIWKDEKEHTRDQMRVKVENWFHDPTSLIEHLDGRLTWIEGATPQQLEAEAALNPPIFIKVEEILDVMSQRLPSTPLDPSEFVRRSIEATFSVLECYQPSERERLEPIKQRVLSFGPARRMALQAVYWHDTKNLTLEQMKSKLEAWFEAPESQLNELEERVDEVEELSSQEIEKQIASLPSLFQAILGSGKIEEIQVHP